MPLSCLAVSIKELCKQSEFLQGAYVSEQLNGELIRILTYQFDLFFERQEKGITYNELAYQEALMNALISKGGQLSEEAIKEVLFYFNFNQEDYIAYLCKELSVMAASLQSKLEKVSALRFEQKTITQLRTKPDCALHPDMPSLKNQVSQWLDAELKFFDTNLPTGIPAQAEGEAEGKIQTSLSVAKLALLVRLMVVDKIITNRIVAPVLRIVVKMTATLQTENIAFGSLETKYHNPDRGTIAAVKDMLIRWINILSKL